MSNSNDTNSFNSNSLNSNTIHEPTLVAYDFSGSTSGSTFYHSTVQSLVSQLDHYDVLLWDHSYREATPQELEQINLTRRGSGGTSPIQIAIYCHEHNTTGHLILITDGQISSSEVTNLDHFLSSHPLSITDLECYLISSYKYSKLDATVIAPFLSRFPHKVSLFHEGEAEQVLVSNNSTYEQFISQLQSINTIAEFTATYDELFSGVISKMLGKTKDETIRDELLQIQKRLLNEMKQLPEGFNSNVFESAFSTHNVSQMVQQCKSVNLKFYRKYPSPEWPAMLFHLLRMCSGNLNTVYSLSALGSRFNPDRVHKADVVKNFKITSLHVTDDIQSPSFICPISYQEEHDVVILLKKPDHPLLSYDDVVLTSNGMTNENTVSNEMLDNIMGNPLSAIRYPEFIQKLINSIDHPISLRSMKEAEEQGTPITVSPLTRAQIIGGICLGPTMEHVSATNWAIAQLTADGKHLGHSDLWFALIWYLVSQGKIPYLTQFLPQFTEHMKYRLLNSKAAATLTMNPYNCLTEIPFGAAVWFTLSLSSICAEEEQATEILSAHVSHFDILKKLLEITEYPLPEGVPEYLERFETKAELLRFIQSNDREILNAIIASAFCYIKCKDKYIPIDGIPEQAQVEEALAKLPDFIVRMSAEKRKGLAILAQTPADKIDLNVLDKNYETINWCYGLKEFDIPEVAICPATGRPYIQVPPENQRWDELAEEKFGPLEEQIHLHFKYIEYVRRKKAFPSKEQFLLFVYEEFVPSVKPTLPKLVQQFVEAVLNDYQKMLAESSYTVKEFVQLVHLTASRTRRARFEMEFVDNGVYSFEHREQDQTLAQQKASSPKRSGQHLRALRKCKSHRQPRSAMQQKPGPQQRPKTQQAQAVPQNPMPQQKAANRQQRGGYGQQRGGNGQQRGGFGQQRGGNGQQRGGFGQQRGGYGQQRGGNGQRRGGYGQQRGGYGQQRGGYGQRRGGYGQQRGGYGQRRGGYGKQRGGYGQKRGEDGQPKEQQEPKKSIFDLSNFPELSCLN